MKYFYLTTPQKNIWNLQTYYENTAIANICGTVLFQEKRDTELLKKAINYAIKKHTALRLQFTKVNGEIQQYVKEYSYIDIPTIQFTDEAELEHYANEAASSPIGLSEHEMYRFAIISIGDKQGILATLSHLIADAWTFSLIINAVDSAYRNISKGIENSSDPADYTSFIQSEADYFSSPKYKKDEIYWQEKYAFRPERTSVKPGSSSSASVSAKRLVKKLQTPLSKGIQLYCKNNSVTPAVLFETALSCYLFRINPDNNTTTIGLPILNRTNIHEQKTAGMFISTLPLTIGLCENDTINQLFAKITEAHFQVFRHQKYPYNMILENLRKKQNFEGNLYDVMFSFQNAKSDTDSATKWYSNGYSEVPFALHVDNRDSNDTYTLTVDYQTEVFKDDKEVYDIINRLEYILEQILENTDICIKDISILPDDEKLRLLSEFNNTKVDYPMDKCVHELFSEQAKRVPDEVALIASDKTLSYRELDELSNRVAHALINKGVVTGDIIAFALERKSYLVAVMIGILKSGAAYMPIDKEYPEERIEYMLRDSQARIFITEDNYGEYTGFPRTDEVRVKIAPKSPCYCIYTSGSTGKPKGTLLHHQGIVNLLSYDGLYSVIKDCKRIALLTTITFDVATQEIFTTLLFGYTGYLMNEKKKMSVAEVLAELEKNKIDMLFCTPSYLNIISKNVSDACSLLKSIKCIALAGERFFVNDTVKAILEKRRVVFENQYGPAETHVITTTTIRNLNDITIGKPIANTQIYILDKSGNLTPIGVPGELCVAGDGVGLGYLNRPDLTAERFVSNPFATEENGHGKVMYHTGDLAAWRENGEIDYLGRIDTQVKIRGLRIELGEIESVMAEFPGIRMCAVTDKKDDAGRQYLVGYYTTASDEDNTQETPCIDERSLRQHLQSKLPKYMVPNYFMHLSQMPMTPSGKTDRKNLPTPELITNDEKLKLPQNDIEARILSIWEEELHIEKLGCNQDFFEVGGDSLLAIGLLTRLEKEFGARLQMKDIFENHTVEQLATKINDCQATGRSIAISKKDVFLLTPQQRSIYLATQKAPDTLLYNMPAFIRLPNTIDRNRLVTAIQKVFDNYQILRMHVKLDGNGLRGIIDHSCKLNIENYPEDARNAFIRPFNLMQAPLFRVAFSEDYLLIDMHHIISDGTSLQLIINALQTAYENGKCIPETAAYSDYSEYLANYLKSEKAEQGLLWYRENLSTASKAIAFPKPENKSAYEGANYYYKLTENTKAIEKAICNRYKITSTMLHMATYALLLKTYSSFDNVSGSIVVTNRQHFETNNTLGMFVNTLPLTWSFESRQTIEEYLTLCKEKLLKIYEYEEIPFATILENVPNTDATFFNTSFVYQASPVQSIHLSGTEITPEFADTHTAKFDLTIEVTPDLTGDCLRLEYRTAIIDEQLAERMARSYENILLCLAEKAYVDEITALTEEEEQKILYKFNNTKVDYPRDKCVHELFTEQAKKTPNAVAIVFEDHEITYKKLDEMSNVLAHILREKGVTRGDIVPIIAQRSWHIIAAMLGILKAGAGYMPIAPDYPKDRVQFIINEAKSRVGCVLGYEEQLDGIELIKLDKISFENADTDKKLPLENLNKADDVCYVIFTSGSTGVPKGVMIKHENVTNYCHNNNNNNVCHAIIKEGYKKIISVTNIVFDIFVTESILPLLNGMSIYFTNDEKVFKQSAINRVITENAVEVLQTTPTKMKGYLFDDTQKEYLATLKVIILGGEALTVGLYEELKKQTTATIFNIYGPAETTVWSSNARVDDSDITIGKPIANTQIYILDKQQNPVPIGVPGELCIAGDGVGLGYLNRPELTAERFVPNPFATDENGHGKIMYHTGDLAAWRENGDIEYLGRIDTQVKIRGLRIELGEIESVMAEFPGIRMCAVTDKKDDDGRQYLVGYYTTESSKSNTHETPCIDERSLRQHLQSKLPKYMVPNYFMHLSQMPMTPSGKTDRKNLPTPVIKSEDLSEYVAPITEQECKLCEIMEEVLRYSPIGLTHDFFSCGGDSLKAMEFIVLAESEGFKFKLQDIFEHPTAKELLEILQEGNNHIQAPVTYTADDFTKYAPILSKNIVADDYCVSETPIQSVFLSGITGFLGAHIADALLQDTDCVVYCLIRDTKVCDATERLSQILKYYFGDKYADAFGTRIIPVIGDITDEGLSAELPDKVDMIIHSAATVKHYGSYDYFYKVNTLGTKHMTDYALRIGARFIHISTISVSGNSLADSFDTEVALEERYFTETSLYQEQSLSNVYVRSKFEAECVVLDAMLNGLQANIIRVGNLTNRSSDYVFQPNYSENAFLSRIKAGLELGCLPDNILPLYSEFSPIDDTADAIVRIAKHFNTNYTIFHAYSNKNLYFDRLLEILKELSIDMNIVDSETFTKQLKATVNQNKTHIYEAFLNDIGADGKLDYETNIHIQNDFTLSYLKKLGFEWPLIDYEYIKGYIEYFKKLGYLEDNTNEN